MCIKATVNVKRLGTSGSTSGRGARALYHDDAPRDFGPKVALHASFQIPVQDQSIRQGGREMSAPRPYVTDPFLTTSYVPFNLTKSSISVYIQLTLYFLSHLVSALVAQCTHAYLLNEKTGVVHSAMRNVSGWLVEIKMAVNSISWQVPSKFRFYSKKPKRNVYVRPYLIEFKRLLESRITAIKGVKRTLSAISSR